MWKASGSGLAGPSLSVGPRHGKASGLVHLVCTGAAGKLVLVVFVSDGGHLRERLKLAEASRQQLAGAGGHDTSSRHLFLHALLHVVVSAGPAIALVTEGRCSGNRGSVLDCAGLLPLLSDVLAAWRHCRGGTRAGTADSIAVVRHGGSRAAKAWRPYSPHPGVDALLSMLSCYRCLLLCLKVFCGRLSGSAVGSLLLVCIWPVSGCLGIPKAGSGRRQGDKGQESGRGYQFGLRRRQLSLVWGGTKPGRRARHSFAFLAGVPVVVHLCM